MYYTILGILLDVYVSMLKTVSLIRENFDFLKNLSGKQVSFAKEMLICDKKPHDTESRWNSKFFTRFFILLLPYHILPSIIAALLHSFSILMFLFPTAPVSHLCAVA